MWPRRKSWYLALAMVLAGSLFGGLWYLAMLFQNYEYYQKISAKYARNEALSPCESREPPLSTCSEFAAVCVAYFKSPPAPSDTLRSQMGDLGVNSCHKWKAECLETGMWQGPNCVMINVKRQ